MRRRRRYTRLRARTGVRRAHAAALKDELTVEENLRALVALAGETASRDAVRDALVAVALSRATRAAGARAFARPAPAHRARAACAAAARRCGCSTSRRRRSTRPGFACCADLVAQQLARPAASVVAATHQSLDLPAGSRGHVWRWRERPRSPLHVQRSRTTVSAPPLRWAVARDLRLALRSRAELGVQLLFYVIVVSLFPLAILARTRAARRRWVPACSGWPRCSRRCCRCRGFSPSDFADGTLEQIALSPYPLPALVVGQDRRALADDGPAGRRARAVARIAVRAGRARRWRSSRSRC